MKKNSVISDDVFINDAQKIVSEGQDRGITLRIMGALAIYLHSQNFSTLHEQLNRLGVGKQRFTDLDFMGYSKQSSQIYKLFEELGYPVDRRIQAFFGRIRGIWYHPQNLYHVDVFYDTLLFSHDIYFGSKPGQGRLDLDSPTITLTDIFLEKTQIHEINEKDIKDLIVLLRGHAIGHSEDETINLDRISEVICNDWGFWYDMKINLEKILHFLKQYYSKKIIDKEDFEDISNKTHKIISHIDNTPKTKNWQKRSKIGTDKPWWCEVEEVER